MSSQLSDTELWQAIVADDYSAFNTLFDKYWSPVFSTAYRYLKNEDACKEIVHDIFLSIWLKRGHLQIECMQAYLRASARYHVYKHIKSAKAAPVAYVADWEDMCTLSTVNSADYAIEYTELQNELDNKLGQLPKRCREIFILSRQQHLSNDQIAGMLGISKRTVENQLTHALHHLRMALKKASIICLLLIYLWR